MAAGSESQAAPPTKLFRESGDVFSAQKALALRQRIVPNFHCETGDVIPHALKSVSISSLPIFIAAVGEAPIADKTF